jgi:hypothetical protein
MKIQRRVTTILTTFAIATALCVAPTGSSAGTGSQGRALWGTWYVSFDAGAGANIPALLTIHRDGTLAASDASDFGGPPFPVQSTPMRGVWVTAGHQMFEAAAMYLDGDVSSGQLLNITSAYISIRFESDFDHISGTVLRDIFECPTPFTCPDPVTAAPDNSLPSVAFRGTRLRVEP